MWLLSYAVLINSIQCSDKGRIEYSEATRAVDFVNLFDLMLNVLFYHHENIILTP